MANPMIPEIRVYNQYIWLQEVFFAFPEIIPVEKCLPRFNNSNNNSYIIYAFAVVFVRTRSSR